jgi:uncharacterized protein
MRHSHSNLQNIAVILLALLFVLVMNQKAPAAETLSSLAWKYYYGQGVPKNLHKAFRLYRKAARKGDVDAMFIVGGMYMQGEGTSVNKSEAFKWLYSAALNGRSSKESERILGQFFILGQNVPQDYSEAVHWYELAAKSGDPEAQSELAYLYFTGKRVERDYEKAGQWFEVAAKKGYPLAQYNMGILWYTGNGVATVDMVQAYAWFNLAAANGHNSGEVARRFLETTLSGEELRRGQKISTELYKEIQKLQKLPISQ